MKHRLKDEQGFTLIELLVVVLIIGILAAIAIPVFNNQRAKAQDSQAKATLVSAAQKIELCAQEKDPFTYSGCNTTANMGVTAATATPTKYSDGVFPVVTTPWSSTVFEIQIASSSGKTYSYKRSGTTVTRAVTGGTDTSWTAAL